MIHSMRESNKLSGELLPHISLEKRPRSIQTPVVLRKTRFRGLPKVDWAFNFAATACNLVRAPKLAVPA